jgi:hypothetical protein
MAGSHYDYYIYTCLPNSKNPARQWQPYRPFVAGMRKVLERRLWELPDPETGWAESQRYLQWLHQCCAEKLAHYAAQDTTIMLDQLEEMENTIQQEAHVAIRRPWALSGYQHENDPPSDRPAEKGPP